MLYELIAVVRSGNLFEIKDIAKTAGSLVLQSGGVIRGYTNWGLFTLPRRTRMHQAWHTHGHYFIMRFDSSGAAQCRLREKLGLDPRMIRYSVVRLAQKLEHMVDVEGQVPWNNRDLSLSAFVPGADLTGARLQPRYSYRKQEGRGRRL
ncbi:MAG: hypothetical protein M1826_005602 [Phylliscum demangeonii]|nr:MAG: hypothetical protein M1826_005602 [Phylliscum demangeonii]